MNALWPLIALLVAGPAVAATSTSNAVPSAQVDGTGISIDAALAASESANIDLISARNAERSAAAGLRSADTAPNPTLTFNSSHFQLRGTQPGVGQQTDNLVRIDLPIERGGKRSARVAAARAALAAAGSDVRDAGRLVRAAVVTAFYDLMAAEQKLALNGRIADSYRTSLRVADKRLAAGAISGGDLARQTVETLRAASALSQADSDRREAQLALAILIGREAEAPALHTIGDWPVAVFGGAEPAESVAERRPDVRAARARVEAARYQLDGAHALRHPDISVGVQYENDPLSFGSTVGAGFSVPIPVRNRYRGEVDAASAGLLQAEALGEKAATVAIADITLARRAAAEASARRADYDGALLPAARKAAATAEFSYRNGALALLDLLDARRTLQTVELGAIDAHLDEAHAIARLTAAETAGDD